MKTILTIGATQFLFPDAGAAARVLTALQKATVVQYYGRDVEAGTRHSFEARLELTVLPPGTKYKRRKEDNSEPDEPIEIQPRKPRAKALPHVTQFMLPG